MRVIETILCLCGFHNFRTRTHGAATERVCMREGCTHFEKLQERRDDPSIHIFQKKKSPRMRKIIQ